MKMKWIYDLLPFIATSVLAEVPQGNGGSVSGKTAPPDGTGNAGTPGAEGVNNGGINAGNTSPNAVSLTDTNLYLLDPDNADTAVLGTQLKEALHRSRQVDSMQSELHKTQNAYELLQQEAATLHEENEGYRIGKRVKENIDTELSRLQVNRQNTDPNDLDDNWGLDDNTPGSPDLSRIQNTPGSDINQLVGIVQNLANQVQSQSDIISGMQGQLKQVGQDVDSSLASVQQRETERQNREMMTQTLSGARNEFGQKLRDIGVHETEITRIAQMKDQALEGFRQAEEIAALGGEANLASARMVLAQAQKLWDDAVDANTQAREVHNQQLVRQQNTDLLNSRYAGLDPQKFERGAVADRRHFKQEDADAANRQNVDAAIELIESRERARQAIG